MIRWVVLCGPGVVAMPMVLLGGTVTVAVLVIDLGIVAITVCLAPLMVVVRAVFLTPTVAVVVVMSFPVRRVVRLASRQSCWDAHDRQQARRNPSEEHPRGLAHQIQLNAVRDRACPHGGNPPAGVCPAIRMVDARGLLVVRWARHRHGRGADAARRTSIWPGTAGSTSAS
jgi:hypothetical protein